MKFIMLFTALDFKSLASTTCVQQRWNSSQFCEWNAPYIFTSLPWSDLQCFTFPSLPACIHLLSAPPHLVVFPQLTFCSVVFLLLLLFCFCSTCPPASVNNSFSVHILPTTEANHSFIPAFLSSFPCIFSLLPCSLSPSLAPFDPRFLFSPAVFSLIWSVSLQGCNTSMLPPNKSWRSLRTFHYSTFPEQSMLHGVLMCSRSLSLQPYLHHTAVSYGFSVHPSCRQWYH